MKLVLLISALNEEKTIKDVITSIPRIEEFSQQYVVVIDDGCIDKTAMMAEQAGAIVVHHPENRGLGVGFQTGIAKALDMKADMVVMIDADGQFPASEMTKLIKPILEGKADMVTASRFLRKEDFPTNIPPVKAWGNKQIAWLISTLLGKKYYDVACGFRAYSREALLNISVSGKFTYTQEVFIDLSMKDLTILEVPVKVKYFKGRKSRIFKGAFDYAFRALKIIIRTFRDYKPMIFFGLAGLVPFILSIFTGGFSLFYFFKTGSFTPYKFLGFIGIYLITLAFLFWIVGLFADMFVRIRISQERILYTIRKSFYQ